jgi:DNA (cytosine-5)-methyltransferase 3A
MKAKKNIVSLFDGISCARQSLERSNIDVGTYYASEIDKYAIQVTMANYPDTIQLGSVVNVNAKELPKIDMLFGGSPCQSFSFAGKRKGMSTKCETEILTLDHYLELKNDGFEFEGQSYLFWEYCRVLKELRIKNPDILFLLENVEMGEKWEKVLSKAIGVNGIHINSSLVSAQNRKRIYWTNIGMEPMGLFGDLASIIKQPKDRGILLKDILESEVDNKYYLSDKLIAGFERHKVRHDGKGTGFAFKPKTESDSKGNSLRANAALAPTDNMLIVHNTQRRDPNRPAIKKNKNAGGSGHLTRTDGKTYCLDSGNTNAVEIVALTEVRTQEAKRIRRETGTNPKREKELVERTDGKIGAILTSQTPDNLIKISNSFGFIKENKSQYREVKQISENNKSNGGTQPYQQDRIYDVNGISPALSKGKSDLLITELNDNQKKKFNPNIKSDKANALTLAQGRAGSSSEYMDAVSKIANITSRIRRLTPLECMRLQTISDNYLMPVSDSQRYKQLGNGWTIEVISHILNYIK